MTEINVIEKINALSDDVIKDIIKKVGMLSIVEEIGATKEEVARFFNVGIRTLDRIIGGNCNELEGYGKYKFEGNEIFNFASDKMVDYKISRKTRKLLIFNRKHILFFANLLYRGSDVAKSLVKYMIEVESLSTTDTRVKGALNAIEEITKQARIEIGSLEDELTKMKLLLAESKPKIEFADTVMQCDNTISLNNFSSITYGEFGLYKLN